uniref:Uncharacterized protein n=1 Tax=Glossina austeni TaxID=7395 RepID=A0A1A9UV77_GLOAU
MKCRERKFKTTTTATTTITSLVDGSTLNSLKNRKTRIRGMERDGNRLNPAQGRGACFKGDINIIDALTMDCTYRKRRGGVEDGTGQDGSYSGKCWGEEVDERGRVGGENGSVNNLQEH